MTVADLARTLGVSAPTVVAWAAIGGIKLPVPAAKRQWRTACPLAGVELPRWVPPHLEAEFWRVAEREDEHAAAARVRKLKAAERVFTV